MISLHLREGMINGVERRVLLDTSTEAYVIKEKLLNSRDEERRKIANEQEDKPARCPTETYRKCTSGSAEALLDVHLEIKTTKSQD